MYMWLLIITCQIIRTTHSIQVTVFRVFIYIVLYYIFIYNVSSFGTDVLSGQSAFQLLPHSTLLSLLRSHQPPWHHPSTAADHTPATDSLSYPKVILGQSLLQFQESTCGKYKWQTIIPPLFTTEMTAGIQRNVLRVIITNQLLALPKEEVEHF